MPTAFNINEFPLDEMMEKMDKIASQHPAGPKEIADRAQGKAAISAM